ncbi:unnamed protein product [Paramecium octaurelia]|uniref:RING-type domain-containing protein n=1 Tax=Paramecium octaurelia TaxID=43137 RepID=A0A8S1XSD8_PAROT|nr:unnamed protein product [Paramecium octaurelia]
MNQCLICFEDTEFRLNCQHYYCLKCLVNMIQVKLKALQLTTDDYKCPECKSKFSVELFKNTEIYNDLIEYSLKHNCIENLNDDEMIVDCGHDDCNNKFIVSKNAKYSRCPVCKQIYCLNCRKPYESKCCQQSITGKCPRCKIQVFKEEGCNFLKCQSQYCKGQVYFCGICFLILKKEDHYSHFIDNNPYNACRIGKIKPNKQKCPGCLTLNPLQCQIIENLNQCYCKSNVCKESLYCLNCSKKIQKNEAHECKQCSIM